MKNNNTIMREFDGQEVVFRQNQNGVSEVKIDEVAKFCGWTRIAKSGNEVIRWERVNEYLCELGVPTSGHGDFIPEFIMYPLIGKANNPLATKFMLWVGQVLTDLRTKGVVILEHAKEEAIDFEKKFGKYRIRKTFTNSTNVIEDYKQFVELSKLEWKSKRLNNQDRVKLSNIISGALEDRINNNVLDLKPSEIIGIQEMITDIKTDIIKLENKKHGGLKTGQTKKIKQLQEELDNVYPNSDEFTTLNCHGFSNNYMYKYAEGNTYKTESYRNWIKYFPNYELPDFEYLDTDKKVEIFIEYIAKADMDIRNFDKSFIDTLFHEIGVDDNIVDSVHSKRIGVCDEYKEGKIKFYIRNVM